ncbi:hypothetical protein RB2150_17947 [Rhodobacterales bacterium HTCC2150]|nr:hypothetical protein RB2150_17947 [Rhodobacterales bacterium HTCC2150] [Rhodobacteraceae bacterium HTCC2150]
MNNYSNKELRAFAVRSARGAYMPWGLAEEAGGSLAWLERHGVSTVSSYIALLQEFDGKDPATLGPSFSNTQEVADRSLPICPILTGAYLSDKRGGKLAQEPLVFPAMMMPHLLLPFLVWVAQDLSRTICVKWSETTVLVGPEGFEIIEGQAGLVCDSKQSVEIALNDGNATPNHQYCPRTQVSDAHRNQLEGFVVRTYLPESEHSQKSGAGGGSVDDD